MAGDIFMQSFILDRLANTVATLQNVMADTALVNSLGLAAEATGNAMLAGGKLMIAGNGGSAADAQHLAAEFVSRLTVDRPAMRAIALTTDTSALTATANDYGYERVFERQIEALGAAGDVFLAISTSGNSPNVLRALTLSRSLRILTIGFSGRSGGNMAALCDYNILVPSNITAHIQEAHVALEHIFCALVERAYFGAQFFEAEKQSVVIG